MADPWNPTGESFLRAGDVVLRGRSLNQQFERALAQERIQREQQALLRRGLESEEAARFITPEQLPPEYRTPGMGRIPTATFPLWSESIKTGRAGGARGRRGHRDRALRHDAPRSPVRRRRGRRVHGPADAGRDVDRGVDGPAPPVPRADGPDGHGEA